MGILGGFGWGVLGGFLAELLGLFQLRKQAPPEFPRSRFYWFLTMGMILAGGALVVVYLESDMPLKPILAVNLGASAPLVISKLVAQTEPIPPGRVN